MKTPARPKKAPARTLLARDVFEGKTIEVKWRGDEMISARERKGTPDLICGFGFFDLQCNGYAGVDYNTLGTSPEAIAGSIRAMWAHGCTHVLPTIITNTPDALEALFQQLTAALELDPLIADSVPGFHLEGPFISPVDGARGAHPLAAVRPVDQAVWERCQAAAGGRIRMVTVAPEVEGALPFISKLRDSGVVPAIGHTMATRAQVAAAAKAGALASTHLGNGCPQELHRHVNPITAQLAEDGLAATFITDGIHLPPEVVQTYWRAKGSERSLVVTDAMSAAGAPPGRYPLAGLELEVGADRVVRFPGGSNFAGSALTMNEAVANAYHMAALEPDDAWAAGSIRPWELMVQVGTPMPDVAPWIVAEVGEKTCTPVLTLRGNRVLYAR